MKILILGSNGMLGPHVERVLQEDHQLLLTDVGKTYDGPNEYRQLDVAAVSYTHLTLPTKA